MTVREDTSLESRRFVGLLSSEQLRHVGMTCLQKVQDDFRTEIDATLKGVALKQALLRLPESDAARHLTLETLRLMMGDGKAFAQAVIALTPTYLDDLERVFLVSCVNAARKARGAVETALEGIEFRAVLLNRSFTAMSPAEQQDCLHTLTWNGHAIVQTRVIRNGGNEGLDPAERALRALELLGYPHVMIGEPRELPIINEFEIWFRK